jgi:phytoene/squalene synthetase
MFSVTENMFELNKINHNFINLMKFSFNRVDKLLAEGQNLLNFLPGKLKIEIKWTLLGGREILNKIRKNEFDVFIRPKLNKTDFLILLFKSLI